MNIALHATSLVYIYNRPGISGSEAGFILGFAHTIGIVMHAFCVALRDSEIKGVSLERTTEYRELDRETNESLDTGTDSMDDIGWPAQGSIRVDDLRVRYASDQPNILHGISFDIQGGQRVGVVGATGGGKSTLAKAFFSFVEITGGHIEIDGKGM